MSDASNGPAAMNVPTGTVTQVSANAMTKNGASGRRSMSEATGPRDFVWVVLS